MADGKEKTAAMEISLNPSSHAHRSNVVESASHINICLCWRFALKVLEVVFNVMEIVFYMMEVVNGVRCVLWVLGVMRCMLFCVLLLYAAPYSGERWRVSSVLEL